MVRSKLVSQKDLFVKSQPTLLQLTNENNINNVVYTDLLSQSNVKADSYGTYPLFQVTIPALLPEKPTTPNLTYGIAGGVVGSIINLITLFILSKRQNKDKNYGN